MNKVAVIMSIYQTDKLTFVRPSVQSILHQSYTLFDYYIYFDGYVKEDIKCYISGLDDERIHVYDSPEKNRGLAYAMNYLLSIVIPMGYEYIARMDADDISEPTRFERQLYYYGLHPEIDCLGTFAIEITTDGKEYFKKSMPETHAQCLNLYRKRDCMIHPTVMFRRSYFEKAGLYNTDTYFGEDTMMWAKGFVSGCIMGNVPEYLFKYRLDELFFDRRRGWKHAINIYKLRHRVNKMMGFGILGDFWAIAYAIIKLMPKTILNILYKILR